MRRVHGLPYFVWIAHDHFMEQHVARRVIVTIDKTGDNGPRAGVNRLCAPPAPCFCLFVRANRKEPSIFHGKRLCGRHLGIDGKDVGVQHEDIAVLILRNADGREGRSGEAGQTRLRFVL